MSLPGALRIGDTIVSFVAQADDVALLALSPRELQIMINIVYKYSLKWRFQLDVSKTKIMVFGESKSAFNKRKCTRQWHLGTVSISQVYSYKHLGKVLCASGSCMFFTLIVLIKLQKPIKKEKLHSCP